MDNLLDKIVIKDLLVRCILGVNEEERREKQDVLINLTLFADLHPSGRSDDLADSVDYRSIKKQVLALAEESRFHLVEALAERIAEQCLANHRVQRVQVTVEKPSALRFARSVGVEITRSKTSPP